MRNRVKKFLNPNSVVSRIGGDEFAILIPVTSRDMKESNKIAQSIISALNSQPLNVNGHDFLICSVGMTYAEPGKDLKVLLNEADMAMYEAKCNGRSTLRVH